LSMTSFVACNWRGKNDHGTDSDPGNGSATTEAPVTA
jgi:hypothetical protein